MELQLMKCMLYLIYMTIVATKDVENVSEISEQKPIFVRSRGSYRYASKNSTTLSPRIEKISSNLNVIPSNINRRISSGCRNSLRRCNVSNINNTVLQENTTQKSKINTNDEHNVEKSKVIKHGSRKLPLQQFTSRSNISHFEISTITSKNISTETKNDRRYLPQDLNEKVKNEYFRKSESKVRNTPQTTSKQPTQFIENSLKRKIQTTEASAFSSVTRNSRSRTGRWIQNINPLSEKQVNNNNLPDSKFLKDNTNKHKNSTPKTVNNNVSSNKRSRKTTVELKSNHNRNTQGSVNVPSNISSDFDSSRKLVNTTPFTTNKSVSGLSEQPKILVDQLWINTTPFIPNKSVTRLTDQSKVLEDQSWVNNLTENKNLLQRNFRHGKKSHADSEFTTELSNRIRNRNNESKKINPIAKNNPTLLKSDFRRQKFNVKSSSKDFNTSRRPEQKNTNRDNNSSNRSKNLRKPKVASIDILNQSESISSTSKLLLKPENTLKEIAVPSNAMKTVIATTEKVQSPLISSKFYPQNGKIKTIKLNSKPSRKNIIGEKSIQQNNNQSQYRASKEDFFNHGLGFRGRTPPIPVLNTVTPPVSTTTTVPIASTTSIRFDNTGRGNPGWTLRRRPGHWYDNTLSGPPGIPAQIPNTMNMMPRPGTRVNNTVVQQNNGEKQMPVFQASQMTSAQLFPTRSRIKLENTPKTVNPELGTDETIEHQVIVSPFQMSKNNKNYNMNHSESNKDEKVLKIPKALSMITDRSEIGQRGLKESDWKQFKLQKNTKEMIFSRYKQPGFSTIQSRATTASSVTQTSAKNYENPSKLKRLNSYQEYKYKFLSPLRENMLHETKPSYMKTVIQDSNSISTTPVVLHNKSEKILTLRKNDKKYMEDLKAVALKLRKNLENREKTQMRYSTKRRDSTEGSTTLLTTIRTVRSFSFSTRLGKMSDSEPITPSTEKIIDNEMLSTTLSKYTSSIVDTTTENPSVVETTLPRNEKLTVANNHSSFDNHFNEINDHHSFDNNEPPIKTTSVFKEIKSKEEDLNKAIDSVNNCQDCDSAASVNSTGSSVFIVYPAPTENPLPIAFAQMYRYETANLDEESSNQYQLNIATTIPKSTNIFNPVKSAATLESKNIIKLKQNLESTVSSLLSTLENKSSPSSSGYKNSNSVNSLSRIIPSGALPKFNARYKGAELFLKSPIFTTSSFSQKNELKPQIQIWSRGEPNIITFDETTEGTGINNEHTNARQLWQINQITTQQITMTKDPLSENSSNSNTLLSMPVTLASSTTDIPFSSTDSMTTLLPDAKNATNTQIDLKTIQLQKENITNIEAIETATVNGLNNLVATTVLPDVKNVTNTEMDLKTIKLQKENTSSHEPIETSIFSALNNLATTTLLSDAKNVTNTQIDIKTNQLQKENISNSEPIEISTVNGLINLATTTLLSDVKNATNTQIDLEAIQLEKENTPRNEPVETSIFNALNNLATTTLLSDSKNAKKTQIDLETIQLEKENVSNIEHTEPSIINSLQNFVTTDNIINNISNTKSLTETSTALNTEVSVSISDNLNQRNYITTIPSLPFNDIPSYANEIINTTQIPINSPQGSTTSNSFLSTTQSYNIDSNMNISKTQTPSVTVSSELLNPLVSKELDKFKQLEDTKPKTDQTSTKPFTTVRPETINPLLPIISSNTLNTNNQFDIKSYPSMQAETSTVPENNFDTNKLTPVPKYSSSSSTVAPVRDYVIYGIYPNKTIVRKKPEENLIDSRNVNSPYVIFGIFPDGKLVRKFPNGTIIPNPPSNPVETIFSLNTTTSTNKPRFIGNQTNMLSVLDQNINLSSKKNPIPDVVSKNILYASNEDNRLGFSGLTTFDLPIETIGSNAEKMTSKSINNIVSNSNERNSRIIENSKKDGINRAREEKSNRIFIPQENNDVSKKANVKNLIDKIIVYTPPSTTLRSTSTSTLSPITQTENTMKRVTSLNVPVTTKQTPIAKTTQPTIPVTKQIPTNKPTSITSSPSISLNSENIVKVNPKPFGTDLNDLIFLNALLEKPNFDESTPKTLTELEKLLANKILSAVLAQTLSNNSSLRTPKAIQSQGASLNSFAIDNTKTNTKFSTEPSNSGSSLPWPIVKELEQISTTKLPSIKLTTPVTWKPIRTFTNHEQPFVSSSTILIPSIAVTTPKATTVKSKIITQTKKISPAVKITKPINIRPKYTTTEAPMFGPFAFVANFFQSIFGSNNFATTTLRPRHRRPAPTAKKIIPTVTTKIIKRTTVTIPIVQSQSSYTPRSVQILNDVITNTNDQRIDNEKSVFIAPQSASTKQSRIYSSEEDSKFLKSLTNIVQSENGYDLSDQALLHTILKSQAQIQPFSTVSKSNKDDETQYAALPNAQSQYRAQIESPTPSSLLNEQLKLVNVDARQQGVGPSVTKTATPTSTKAMTQQKFYSSTYPPSLFSNFGSFASSGNNGQTNQGETAGSSIINAAIGMTRAFGQFLGAAITGATQQFQKFVKSRN